MRNFLIGTLALISSLGCSNESINFITPSLNEDGYGNGLKLIDRDLNGKIDLREVYLTCNGKYFDKPLMVYDYVNRTIYVDSGYAIDHPAQMSAEEGKGFKIRGNGRYIWYECLKAYNLR